MTSKTWFAALTFILTTGMLAPAVPVSADSGTIFPTEEIVVSQEDGSANAEATSRRPVTPDELARRQPSQKPDPATIPIIVELAGPFTAEHELAGAEVQPQRRLIRRVRNALYQDLDGWGPFVVYREYDTIPYVALRVSRGSYAALMRSSLVADIVPDEARRPSLSESAPLIGAPPAWSAGFEGAGRVVAIIDTGVDSSHSFFGGRVLEEACYSAGNCPGGVSEMTGIGSGVPCAQSRCYHGTHVAGISAGSSGSMRGIAPSAGIMAVQVFSAGGAFDSDIIKGMERVYDRRSAHSFAAVNLSLGGGRFTSSCDAEVPAMTAVINNLRANGIATVVAAGNEYYTDALSFPACISTAISVGASSKTDGVADFSNSFADLDLLAPGVDISSSVPGGGFASFPGTSMAAPHVAGAWAVMLQNRPGLSVEDVRDAFVATGTWLTDPKNGLEHPRINLDSALNASTRSLSVSRAGTGGGAVSSSPAGISCGATCTGQFVDGDSVTLTATPDGGSTFVGWSGACAGASPSCVVAMTADQSATATFDASESTRKLTVTRLGDGPGTVASSPLGINCGLTCEGNFTTGVSVTLSATPGPSATFLGWGGACSGTGTCTVAMNQARSVSATFDATSTQILLDPGFELGPSNPHWATSRSGNISGVSPAFGSYSADLCGFNECFEYVVQSIVVPEAVQSATFSFYRGGVTSEPSPDCWDIAFIGFFDGVDLEPAGVYCDSDADGWWWSETEDLTTYLQAREGYPLDVIAFVDADSIYPTRWFFDEVSLFFTEGADRTVTVSKAGAGVGFVGSSPGGVSCGSTCAASYAYGSPVTLSATPSSGSVFTGWAGACSGTGPCHVTLSQDRSVTANFDLAHPRTLSVSKAGSGSGEVSSSPAGITCGPTCSADFPYATNVTLTPTADSGSRFAGWSGACSGIGNCVVSMTQPRAAIAHFDPVDRTLTVSRAGTGSGSVSTSPTGISCGSTCAADFPYSTIVTLTPTADPGSTFTGWSGVCSGTGSCSVSMTQDRAATANFEEATAPHGVAVIGSAFSKRFQRKTSFRVGWEAFDDGSGVESFDVRVRSAPARNGFGAWDSPHWQSHTQSTDAVFKGKPGWTYCFSARARDQVGNESAWSSAECTAIPVNDRSLNRSSGWKNANGGAFFKGTAVTSKQRGATLSIGGLEARSLALVAKKCPSCGKVKVFRGKKLLATIDLSSSVKQTTTIINIKRFPKVLKGMTVKIKVVSAGKLVSIEGLGITRL